MFVKTKAAIESTMKSLYNLIWGQCSESLRSRPRGHDAFAIYSAQCRQLGSPKRDTSEDGRISQQAIPTSFNAQDNVRFLQLDPRETPQEPGVLGQVQLNG
jgi:hypothetical protein